MDRAYVEALSRIQLWIELLNIALRSVSSELLDRIKSSWLFGPVYAQLISPLERGEQLPWFTWKDGLLQCKGKVVIGSDEG